MKDNLSLLRAAMNYAGLTQQNIYQLHIVRAGDVYEICFCTDYMHYDCYVDGDGQVVGFLHEPLSEAALLAEDRTDRAV